MSRESSLGLMFTGVAYYDGQGFLLRREAGIDTALQLGGKTVCTQTGTTSELNLADYFRANDMALKVLALGTAEESRKAYDDRKCDVLTSDVSQLYAERLKLAAPDSHIILPEVISKEPLGPAVRQGDDQWFNLVKWTLYALINAEELGVKSATIDDAMKSANPDIRRLVGHRRRVRPATGPCQRLGRARRSRGRQLRRDLRAKRRNAVPAQHSARTECALDAGRHPVRASRQVIRQGQPMNVDYYALLTKAVAGKDAAARDQIYRDAYGLIRKLPPHARGRRISRRCARGRHPADRGRIRRRRSEVRG